MQLPDYICDKCGVTIKRKDYPYMKEIYRSLIYGKRYLFCCEKCQIEFEKEMYKDRKPGYAMVNIETLKMCLENFV